MGLDLHKINNWFYRTGKHIIRLRWLNIAIFIAVFIVSFMGIKHIKKDTSDDNWFVENDPMLIKQERFEDIFGNNDFAAVLIEVDDVFTFENLTLIREMCNEFEQFVPFAEEILSLTHCEFTLGNEFGIEIIDIIPEDIPQSKTELDNIRQLVLSKQNLAGKLVSKDSKQTWIMLRLLPYPDDWETNDNYLTFVQNTAARYPEFFKGFNTSKPESPEILVGHIFKQISDQKKYKSLNPKTAGLPMISYEKRVWFGKESPRLMMVALLVTILILALSLRSFRGVIFPVISAAGAMIIAFGFQGFTGVHIDPTMIPLPLFLGLAVAIGYSIHIFVFYRRHLEQTGSPKEAAISAIGSAGWPILFTALTTIGALMSFLFIRVSVLRWVGLTSAALIGITFVLTITILPSLLSFGKVSNRKKATNRTRKIDLFLGNLHDFVMAHQTVIMVCFILITAICIYGLTLVEVSFDIKKTMGTKVPYVQRLDYIGSSQIGSLYSYNLGLEFDEPGAAKNPANLRKFEILEKEIQQLPLTKKTTSILDILKDLTQVLNDGQIDYYKIPGPEDISDFDTSSLDNESLAQLDKQILAQTMLLYENAGGTEAERWIDYDEQRLHLMVEMRTYSSAELQRELVFIREQTEALFPDANLIEAGMVIKYAAMQDIVGLGQIRSFLIALCIIAVLLMAVFGNIKTGLIGMIPNIAPALITGGIMGFFDIPLDMITVTIMPMLLGLAVDDTIHFINHSQLEFQNTQCYQRSMRRTCSIVGSALIMTSVILIINFSTSNLGLLAVSGITAALVSDLFITPILLKKFKVFGEETDQSTCENLDMAS